MFPEPPDETNPESGTQTTTDNADRAANRPAKQAGDQHQRIAGATAISFRSPRLLLNPGFWILILLFLLVTLPHYAQAVSHPTFLDSFLGEAGLTRRAFERILFLAPIIWAGFLFGARGALVSSIAAIVLMLPWVVFTRSGRVEALLEIGAVAIVGNVFAITLDSIKHARQRREELEKAQVKLQASEQRYRSLFEDAHDAIWIQDMDGTIIDSNAANTLMTGFERSELIGMNVRGFLDPEALGTARELRRRLLSGEKAGQTQDQKIIRKDGSKATVRLSSSIIRSEGKPVGFQHIARDITEERRLQENRRQYIEQVTRAQEQERKRISRELHDDTVQSLVVLSRQIDSLATSKADVPSEIRKRLEELWQQCTAVMQGVRRLSQDLRPAQLDRLGLLPALQMLAESTARYSGIPTQVQVVGTERRLGEEVELVLFRIVQEALRNAWRHSKATKTEVTVEFTNYKVRISIADNGIGFDVPASVSDFAQQGKLGLAGMEERARLIGATLTAGSQSGKGTRITIELAA
jgi:PAS domain S-box-containing protein